MLDFLIALVAVVLFGLFIWLFCRYLGQLERTQKERQRQRMEAFQADIEEIMDGFADNVTVNMAETWGVDPAPILEKSHVEREKRRRATPPL